jgi:pilus assembly protein CpaB
MDRRFLTVMGISLLFALVISTLFYTMTSRASGRSRTQKKVEMINVATATVALPVGMEIKPTDVKLVSIPRDSFPNGAFEKIEQVVGRPVISNILMDEAVVAGRLAERGSGYGLAPIIPTGMRAVAVKVNEVVGVAGFVFPGMRVDVLVTMRPAGDGTARTSTVLQNIVVAAAGQQIQPDSTGKAVNVPVVTLLVTPDQAETLTLAGNEGRVQLVLRNAGDQGMAKTRGSEAGDLYAPNRVVVAAPAVVRRAASPPPAPAVAAPIAPPPPSDEVQVIRGSQVSMEMVGAGRPK